MLWVLDKHGQSYIPDMVMSVTSMVKRQTNGAAMGLMRAKLAARNGMATVESDGCFNDDRLKCESELYDGKTGNVIITADRSRVAYTWGFTHFIEQTQKSRDKQHYSHDTIETGSKVFRLKSNATTTPISMSRNGHINGNDDLNILVEVLKTLKDQLVCVLTDVSVTKEFISTLATF